jgi:hypothetical protein
VLFHECVQLSDHFGSIEDNIPGSDKLTLFIDINLHRAAVGSSVYFITAGTRSG